MTGRRKQSQPDPETSQSNAQRTRETKASDIKLWKYAETQEGGRISLLVNEAKRTTNISSRIL